MTTLFENIARRADFIEDEEDPLFGTRPDLLRLSERERLAKLLHEAAIKFGDRGLGNLSAMCLLASDELWDAAQDATRAYAERLLSIGGER